MSAQITKSAEGVLLVSGELNAVTVPLVSQQAAALLAHCQGDLQFDLSAVSRADSSGLALLLEWMRTAAERNVKIIFQKLPEQMLKIARVSGIDSLLPLAD